MLNPSQKYRHFPPKFLVFFLLGFLKMFSSSQFDSTSTFTSSQLTQPNDTAPSSAKVSLTFGVFKCMSLYCLASENVWENGNCRIGEREQRKSVLSTPSNIQQKHRTKTKRRTKKEKKEEIIGKICVY